MYILTRKKLLTSLFILVELSLVHAQLSTYQNLIAISKEGLLKPVAEHLATTTEFENSTCANEIKLWLTSMQLENWAIQMFDAGGKLPTGILDGNTNSLGHFDMCLNIVFNETTEIEAKYCLARIPLKPIELPNGRSFVHYDGAKGFNLAICLPNSCSAFEIQSMINSTLSSMGWITEVTVANDECQNNEKASWSAADIVAVVIFGDFAVLVLISTLYDLFARYLDKEPRYHRILISFSLYSNTKKFRETILDDSPLRCLNGIRVLSVMWVILGNRFLISSKFPLLNGYQLRNWVEEISSTFILSSMMAADTFFVLSGLLLSFIFFKKTEGVKSFNLLLFYFHRFLRIAPLLYAIIFFNATLFKFVGSGPLWPSMAEYVVRPCEKYWWTTMLFVQNYVNPLEMCVPQTWHISIDTQLYIVSPIFLYPLLKHKKIGIANYMFWFIMCELTLIILVFTNSWPSAIITNNEEFLTEYYFATHMRASPWILGFAAGYMIYKYSKLEVEINTLLVITGWAISLGILLSIILGMTPMNSLEHVMSKAQDGTFNAFARTAWFFALIWIIFACSQGYGGPVGWFLELQIWEIMARMSYSMFLVHPWLQLILTGSYRTVQNFTNYNVFYIFFGDLIFTIVVSYLLTMTFETPFKSLEEAILKKVPENNIKRKTGASTA